jgi:hypothetical protein
MSGLPHKGTKYKILKIELLVPAGAEMFMDLLSDFRDDNPDELVEWSQAPNPISGLTREAAIAAWKALHNEDITIKETE